MRGSRPSDGELLRRAVEDADGDAFAELYRRHVDAVLAFLRSRVPSPDLALDLTAETFAAAIASAHRYRGDGDGEVIGWLYGIARNKLLESLRRGRVEDAARRALHQEPLLVTDADLALVEERVVEGAEVLRRHLARLPDEIRGALVARVVEERDYAEIAADLGCSEQLVRQRVHRGLRRLRAVMEATR